MTNPTSSQPSTSTRTASLSAPTVPRHAPIPFVRLAAVELRKFADTSTGVVLVAATLLLSFGIMAGRAWFGATGVQDVVTISGAVLSLFLPIMGILAVTGEWSHGTVSTTFSLEPRRARVVLAKTVPPVVVTVVICAVVTLAAFPITGAVSAARGTELGGNLQPGALAGWVVVNVIFVLGGVALGTLLLNAPAAITITVASTMVWSLVAVSSDTGAAIASWLDLGRTTAPLLDASVTGDDLPRIAASLALWVAAPLGVGAVRIMRRDVG